MEKQWYVLHAVPLNVLPGCLSVSSPYAQPVYESSTVCDPVSLPRVRHKRSSRDRTYTSQSSRRLQVCPPAILSRSPLLKFSGVECFM